WWSSTFGIAASRASSSDRLGASVDVAMVFSPVAGRLAQGRGPAATFGDGPPTPPPQEPGPCRPASPPGGAPCGPPPGRTRGPRPRSRAAPVALRLSHRRDRPPADHREGRGLDLPQAAPARGGAVAAAEGRAPLHGRRAPGLRPVAPEDRLPARPGRPRRQGP